MGQETFTDRMGRPVVIDMCHACQCFWFDTRESVALTPGSTLILFRKIGESAGKAQPVSKADGNCPRCATKLTLVHDMQRTTRFSYLACPKGHGRLTAFCDFLREKDFIKPLSPAQIAQLRIQVQSVNCSNCGAPVDVVQGAVCSHCSSPLSMLDLKHTEKLVEQLEEAETRLKNPQPMTPLLALELERIKIANRPRGLAAFEQDAEWMEDVSLGGVVSAGLHAVARWLNSSKT